jgi:hypothetical protein
MLTRPAPPSPVFRRDGGALLADGIGHLSIGFGTTPGARPDLVSVWKRLSSRS